MSNFDQVAVQFELYRTFPPEVIKQIQQAVAAESSSTGGRLLEIGAGTGRFGRQFVIAGCAYFAVDSSHEMLREFAVRIPDSKLIQADACALPFPNQTFSTVLLFHFFGASSSGEDLFAEAARVLDHDGVVIVGQRVGPTAAIDAQMRAELRNILTTMKVPMSEPGSRRDHAQLQFESVAKSHKTIVAASWKADSSPDDFVKRHRTGAWFSALDKRVQDESLARLSDWAIARFGSLEARAPQEYKFQLDVFRL